jgi:hypothetical protein
MTIRAQRFAAGMFTGYAEMVVNISYTALSFPLALHY